MLPQRMRAGVAFPVVLVLSLSATRLQAQTELGIDASVDITFVGGETTFDANIPQANFRVGSLVGERFGLETSFSFQRVDLGSTEANVGAIGVRAMQAFSDQPFHWGGPYVFGGGGLLWANAEGESVNQLSVEAGIGTRLPVRDFFNVRLEAGYGHAFENGDFTSADGIFVGVGFSVVFDG